MPLRVPTRLLASALLLSTGLLPLAGCGLFRGAGPYDVAKTDTAEDKWEKGRAAFDAEEWEKAGDAFHAVWTGNPGHPLAEDARFFEAECRYGMGKLYGAFVLYKSYLNDHPLSRHAPLVQRRLYDMGTYTIQQGRQGVLGLLDYAAEGAEMLEYLVSVFPNGDLADDSLKVMADWETSDDRALDAIEHLKELLQFYPGSEWALQARLDLARNYVSLNRGRDYDADVLQRALAEYRAYIDLVSSDPRRKQEYAAELARAEAERADVIERLAEKSLAKAEYYLRTNDADAAKAQLLSTIDRFPQTRAARSAREQLGLGDAPVAPETPAPVDGAAPPEGGTR